MPARKTKPGKLAVSSAGRVSAPPVVEQSHVKAVEAVVAKLEDETGAKIVTDKLDEIDKQERDEQNAIERVENDVGMDLIDRTETWDDANLPERTAILTESLSQPGSVPVLPEGWSFEDVQKGPPHRSSVLGYTLFSLGFDPQQDGEAVLNVRPTGISRVLAGSRPTVVGMMRDLEPLVDALEQDPGNKRAPHAFLHMARHILAGERTRFRWTEDSNVSILIYGDPTERAPVMQSYEPFHDLCLEMDGDGEVVHAIVDWPKDTGSMWGACCRVVGWSHADVVRELHVTMNLARNMASGKDMPTQADWARLFLEYDRAIADERSIVGIGIRWARAGKGEREDMEYTYSVGEDGLPVLFVDRDAE